MKSDRICANCGRMDERDFARRYCPVRATCVKIRAPVDCRAFVPLDSPESKRPRIKQEDAKCT